MPARHLLSTLLITLAGLALAAPALGHTHPDPRLTPAGDSDGVRIGPLSPAGRDANAVPRIGPLKVRVILLKLADSSGDFSAAERTAAHDAAFGAGPSLAGLFAEQSRGAVTISGTTTAQLTGPAGSSICAGGNDRFSEIVTWASQAAGIAPDEYPLVVLRADSAPCVWAVAGRGYIGAPGSVVYARSWWFLPGNQDVLTAVMAHEFGHNLGMEHEGDWSCTGPDGARATLAAPGACQRNDYASPFSVMGNAYAAPLPPGLSAYNRWQAGWLGAGAIRQVDGDGDHLLEPSGRAGAGVQLLVVNLPAGRRFVVEYRTGVGGAYDSPLPDGVLVRHSAAEAGGYRPADFLLDMNPATTGDEDAALAPGRTFDDPLSEATITVASQDASGALIQVRLGADTTAPPAPAQLRVNGPSASGCFTAHGRLGADDRVGLRAEWRLDGRLVGSSGEGTISLALGCRLGTGRHVLSVVAIDAAGNRTASEASFRVAPPRAPRRVRGRSLSRGRIALTWRAPARVNRRSLSYRVRLGSKVLRHSRALRTTVRLPASKRSARRVVLRVQSRVGTGPWGRPARVVVRLR